MIPYMTFAGKNLLTDMQTVVDFSTSFGNPERSYEYVEIMGKNGSLVIDNNRFNDLEIDFPAFILKDFIPNYRNLMAFLNSQKGYQRLETSHEPDYFRKALFLGTVQPEPTQFLKKGSFTLPFRVHPQRFLKSGEIPVSASSQSNTYTGNPVSIDNPSGISAVSSLAVALNPIQTGTGEPSPTNIRPITGHTSATVTRTGKNLFNGQFAYHNASSYSPVLDGETYTVSSKSTGVHQINMQYITNTNTYYGDSKIVSEGDTFGKTTVTIPTDVKGVLIYVNGDASNAQHTAYDTQIELGSTATEYEPYTSNTYTIDLNGTRYGGTVDLATGVLTVTHASITLNSANMNNSETYPGWSNAGIRAILGTGLDRQIDVQLNIGQRIGVNTMSNYDIVYLPVYVYGMNQTQWKAKAMDVQIVAEYATPQTVQLTAQQISLLTGINYISSSDELTVTVSEPSLLENPTLFDSKPLIRVYGHGTLTVNNQYITVATNPFPYIDIDCDMMDAFYGANNANGYVTLPNDYITLKSGNNYIAYDGTVEITPRWYEV